MHKFVAQCALHGLLMHVAWDALSSCLLRYSLSYIAIYFASCVHYLAALRPIRSLNCRLSHADCDERLHYISHKIQTEASLAKRGIPGKQVPNSATNALLAT